VNIQGQMLTKERREGGQERSTLGSLPKGRRLKLFWRVSNHLLAEK